MKLRNLLMTTAFVFAVVASFAFKPAKGGTWYTVNIGSAATPICVPGYDGPDFCEVDFTGPQCSAYVGGVLKPIFEYPFSADPWCVKPLRHYQL